MKKKKVLLFYVKTDFSPRSIEYIYINWVIEELHSVEKADDWPKGFILL